MSGDPVTAVLSAQVAADGTASALFTLPAHQGWTLTNLSATGSTSTRPGIVKVYRSGVLVDASGAANGDTSETSLACQAGSQIRADWTACDTGSTMTLTVEGETL